MSVFSNLDIPGMVPLLPGPACPQWHFILETPTAGHKTPYTSLNLLMKLLVLPYTLLVL